MFKFDSLTYASSILIFTGSLSSTMLAQATGYSNPTDAQVFKDCMEALLYDHKFSPKRRTELPEWTAAKVCEQQPVNPNETARQIRECMDELMYDRNFSPKKQTEISRFTAARVCSGTD